MSYVLSGLDAAGTPVLVGQETRPRPRRWTHVRSRFVLPVGPPPVSVTGASTLSLVSTLARGNQYPTYSTDDGQVIPAYFVEAKKSRQLKAGIDGQTMTRLFYIHGTSDPTAVKEIGPQVGDLDDVMDGFYVEERAASWYAEGGGEASIVLLTVQYTNIYPERQSGDGSQGTFSYDFGSESEHVDTSIGAQNHFDNDTAQDSARFGNLINATDKEVQGLEINAPILDVTEEHVFTESQFSPSVRRALRDNLQKVNLGAFREFANGEVLFVGASARKQAKRWFVTFQFRVRRNVIDLPFVVTNTDNEDKEVKISKYGWNYLWTETARLEVGVAPAPVTIRYVTRSVHVAPVYDGVNFSVLGIGTDPLP